MSPIGFDDLSHLQKTIRLKLNRSSMFHKQNQIQLTMEVFLGLWRSKPPCNGLPSPRPEKQLP